MLQGTETTQPEASFDAPGYRDHATRSALRYSRVQRPRNQKRPSILQGTEGVQPEASFDAPGYRGATTGSVVRYSRAPSERNRKHPSMLQGTEGPQPEAPFDAPGYRGGTTGSTLRCSRVPGGHNRKRPSMLQGTEGTQPEAPFDAPGYRGGTTGSALRCSRVPRGHYRKRRPVLQGTEGAQPEAVTTDLNGVKGVLYGQLVAPLVEAVKTQQTQITDLQANGDLLYIPRCAPSSGAEYGGILEGGCCRRFVRHAPKWSDDREEMNHGRGLLRQGRGHARGCALLLKRG